MKIIYYLFLLIFCLSLNSLVYAENLFSGCKNTSADITKQIENSRTCLITSDCEVFFPGCPFGCGIAVRKDEISKIKDLIQTYNSNCSPCKYRCGPAKQNLLCKKSRCTLE